MKPCLTQGKLKVSMSSLGEEAAFPAILSGINIQNKTEFDLEEEDEIYEGFGRLGSIYPYRPYHSYDRKLSERELETFVLENDFLRAEFLPQLGGRLWSLIDKKTGENLLYTNDCIRPSNLAVRDAWFSGGVEWNVGVIGHTPLTMDPLFAAQLTDEAGNPVLRMYEYERIRKVVYQMDFWLEEQCPFLNCRMRIENPSAEVIPMYWWSNMAVPEYPGGRILLPAGEAFTSDMTRVYKVPVPYVDGVDVSKYNDIPDQVDYFFHIPEEERKYIAHLNRTGYGLLHISTARLRSRKLFVWGHNDASRRWQEFLTEKAGDYIEIQAGLGKTQYGCIPMAPHTAWEWLEQYGAVQMDESIVEEEFESAQKRMQSYVAEVFAEQKPREILNRTKSMAKTPGKVIQRGSGYGALENLCRAARGEKPFALHLDFASEDTRQQEWRELLSTGKLPVPDPAKRPADFTKDREWLALLQQTVAGEGKENWYAHYQLGLQYVDRDWLEQAEAEFKAAMELSSEKSCSMESECPKLHPAEPSENVWAVHGLAVCYAKEGKREECVRMTERLLACPFADLSMIKEGFSLLLEQQAYKELLAKYAGLPKELKQESRLYFGYIQALAGVGEAEKAYGLLSENGGIELADMREGDDTLDRLWEKLMACTSRKEELPHRLNFSAISHSSDLKG